MKNSGFTGIACALLCLILLVKKTVGFQNFMAVGHRRQHASCGVPMNTHSIVLTTICIPPSSVANAHPTRIFASHNSRIPSTRRTWSPVSSIKTKASKASPIKRTTTAPIPQYSIAIDRPSRTEHITVMALTVLVRTLHTVGGVAQSLVQLARRFIFSSSSSSSGIEDAVFVAMPSWSWFLSSSGRHVRRLSVLEAIAIAVIASHVVSPPVHTGTMFSPLPHP